jgi:hypothetical protein
MPIMNTAEIIQRIRAVGFYPIQVQVDADQDEWSGLQFVGSLDEFFDAAKAMGAPIVFLCVYKLEEEDFHYEPDSSEDDVPVDEAADFDEIPAVEESFDLIVALPSLSDFKKHIGEERGFFLAAKSQLGILSLYVTESWWDSFDEQRDRAIQKLNEDREAIREKMEEQRSQRDENLLKQLRNLLHDPEFSRIPTQRGMKAYALEKFPDLDEVDDFRFTQEIQKLSDKVKSKKRR